MNLNKVVVASDSFKGCLSSMEVASAAEVAIRRRYPQCSVVKVNVADGGEGTVDAIVSTLKGDKISVDVHDPLGRSIDAEYGLVETERGMTAVIEMSAASGLPLLQKCERNPLLTSTYGTGQLIMDAIRRGCRKFLIGIGGSATNDGGTGMLNALGFVFRDGEGNVLEGCGQTLGEIAEIDDSNVRAGVLDSEFIVACDVDTPFCGPDGAAYVFAPQKGASGEDVELLDKGMCSFARLVQAKYGTDIIPIEGAGAAGGLGGAFKVFLDAKLSRGIDMVLDMIDFDNISREADLIITGEGMIDSQTVRGKTAVGILLRAQKMHIPVIAIGGQVEMSPELESCGFEGIYSINEPNTSLEQAMQKDFAMERIKHTVARILESYTSRPSHE